MKSTTLTEDDYKSFYQSIIYGNIDNATEASINSAYRDVCRTISGFAKHRNHDNILNSAKDLLKAEIINELLSKDITNQDSFDKRHEVCCEKLRKKFKDQPFSIGQSQKWINMSLKNLSIIDHKSVEKQYEFFHVPIDSYIIDKTGIKMSTTWSKISVYKEYMEFQHKFRDKYDGIPLDNEFHLWLEAKNSH